MMKKGDMRPNIVYIIVNSIVEVQFCPGLYNSFLTQTPSFEGVCNIRTKLPLHINFIPPL